MAAKKKTTKSKKKLDVKVRMIGELIDATGSAKDSWNPAEISDDMKAIVYIRRLADTWNPAQLNEALKYLGFATIDSWNPAIIEETKNKLVKYFLPTEATGNPITFNTYGNLPYEVSKAEVTFLPKQDLHGYDSPWVGGAGKNKLPLTVSGIKSLNSSGKWNENIYTRNGVTYELLTNSANAVTGIKVNGTADGNSSFILSRDTSCLSVNTEYKINGAPEGAGSSTYRWQVNINDITFAIATEGSDLSATTPATINRFDSYIVVLNGVQITNKIFYPMVRLSTVTDATFAPYENICPISGWTEVNLYVDEEQTATPETTYTETLGATYYGGKVDFVSGEGSEEWDYIVSYDGETLPGEWISDRDAYAPGTTPTTGAEVAYKLSEAVELTLTPQEIELLKGQNVIWTDGDSITIKYKALLN